MRYFKYATKEKQVNLHPFVCWHVGAPQSDYEFINEAIARLAEDPYGLGVYMGDGGECVTKSSKGLIYEQTMAPQEQLNYLVDRLRPVREKLLFGVKGNHGWRTFKDSGLGFDESLCMALQMPYLGTSAFWNLLVNRSSYDIFTHHGLDSGVATGTKVNKAKKLEEIVEADVIMSAHSHICMAIPPVRRAYIKDNKTGERSRINWRTTYGYICGCAYDSRSGYAEDKGYPPILPAHIVLSFDGHMQAKGRINKEIRHQIHDVDANKDRRPNEEDVVSRMSSGGFQCAKHPTYFGRGRPASSCEACWRIYVSKHP